MQYQYLVKEYSESGDDTTAALLFEIQKDEVQHKGQIENRLKELGRKV